MRTPSNPCSSVVEPSFWPGIIETTCDIRSDEVICSLHVWLATDDQRHRRGRRYNAPPRHGPGAAAGGGDRVTDRNLGRCLVDMRQPGALPAAATPTAMPSGPDALRRNGTGPPRPAPAETTTAGPRLPCTRVQGSR